MPRTKLLQSSPNHQLLNKGLDETPRDKSPRRSGVRVAIPQKARILACRRHGLEVDDPPSKNVVLSPPPPQENHNR